MYILSEVNSDKVPYLSSTVAQTKIDSDEENAIDEGLYQISLLGYHPEEY